MKKKVKNNNTVKRYPSGLRTMSALVQRAALASRLGYEFGGKRDLYEAFGYKETLEFQDYLAQYTRGDIAKAVIERPVDASWRLHPIVSDNEKRDTPFEEDWEALAEEFSLYLHIKRLDRLLGLGQYAVLLLGLDDVTNVSSLTAPPTEGKERKLLYIQPYSELNAKIERWDEKPNSPRFGKPEQYQLTTSTGEDSSVNLYVHHSRVVHVVENPLENTVYGVPRLQAVFNRLKDLEKLAGSSAEMYWRGARPGYAAIADTEAQWGEEDENDMQEQLDEFENHLRRWLQLKGVQVQSLAPQVSSPSDAVDVQLTLIAGAAGIPKRILVGSERGELASSQDERAWGVTIDARRANFCEPAIMRPFLDKLIQHGVLPAPPSGKYTLTWPSLATPSEKEKAEVARLISTSIKEYVTIPEASACIMPPEDYLRRVLGYTHEEVQKIKERFGGDFPKIELGDPNRDNRTKEFDEKSEENGDKIDDKNEEN